MTLFDLYKPQVQIDTPIRLIELFAGYGSQAMAMKRIGADFEHYRVVEWDKYAMASYNAVHGTNFETSDVSQIKGIDLGIEDMERFTYLLTYLLLSMYRYQCCRKNGRDGRRFQHKIVPVMASQTYP